MSSYHGCLRLTPLFWFAVAVGGPCIAESEVVLWDGQEDPAVWTETRGLSLSRDAEPLVLDIEQPDSWLRRADLDIDPADVAWIHIRYRARGFETQSTSGEVFYANAHHAFADESYIRLPSLILDDRWHDMWVEVARSMRGDYWDFALGGQITALRLDLVNQAPGTVELAQVRLLRNRPPRRVSPMGQTLSGWADPKGLRMTQDEDGLLHLEVQEPDGWVTLDGLSLDPAAARYFLIRYRATGFADEPTTGQVFYANDRHDIVGDWKVPLSSLTTDGQWHDLVVDAWAAMGTGHVDWLYGGTVHKLRLDLVDQAPGTVDIAGVFVCPRLQATSLADVAVAAQSYLLPAASFEGAGPHTCSLTLPQGSYVLYARVVDSPAGRRLLRTVSTQGAAPLSSEVGDTGGWAWMPLAECRGGRLTIAKTDPSARMLDAFLVTQTSDPPTDAEVAIPRQTTSTMKPAETRPVTVPGVYWAGSMLTCRETGKVDPETDATVTYFRRTVRAPADLQSAWLQVSVDDFFRLYLNGEKIAESFATDGWKTPTLLEITDRLEKGQENCFAIEAQNRQGPGGVLLDLLHNLPDHKSERVVSDGSFRCSAEAPEGWMAPDFDDDAWAAPALQLPPPNNPWSVRIPYVDKSWHPQTECLASGFRDTVRGGESQEITLTFASEKPLEPGEVLVLTLSRAESGEEMLRRQIALSAGNLTANEDGSVTVSGLSIPLSRWLDPGALALTCDLPGRQLEPSPKLTMAFSLDNARPTGNLESEVKMQDGVPVLHVNGAPMYPMIANGYERDKPGMMEAFKAVGHNIAALWIDGPVTTQWWVGPEEYDFSVIDDKITAILDFDPDKLILPITWAAPPPWWGELYPEEIAKFSDGKSWGYYRATPSFSSQQWRQDAAKAMAAFVRYVESRPYASRVLGYWVIGGVSAEWQGWGCHGSHVDNHLMDYSAPARRGFGEFLLRKYADQARRWGWLTVPPIEERLKSELGQFRDPVEGQGSVDFNEYYSEALVDCMLSCCHAAKEATGRKKIVGVYFGYTMEYTNMSWCLQMSGHNRVRKALDSPDVDLFSAPQSYAVRAPGEDMGWMWAWRSMQNAGKLVWPDDDTRTFLSGPSEHTPVVNPQETQQILRRNFGKQLCNLCPQGFLAIISGRELGSPSIAKDTWAIRRAGEYCVRQKVGRKAQIAVVLDEDSTKYLRYDVGDRPSGELRKTTHWNGSVSYAPKSVMPLTGELVAYQRARFARIGAPVDVILQSDLVRHPADYKLYIMLSSFQYDDETLAAVRRLQAQDVTILWCYAPGFIHADTADVDNMGRLTGLHLRMNAEESCPYTNVTDTADPITANLQCLGFGLPFAIAPLFSVDDPDARTLGVYRDGGLPSLAVKRIGQSRAIFCGSPKLPSDLLRNIAHSAGVHIYSDSLDTLAANDRFIMLHTAAAGEKTIRLRERADVVDVFENEVLARDVEQVTLQLPAEETRLLFVGDADEFLR